MQLAGWRWRRQLGAGRLRVQTPVCWCLVILLPFIRRPPYFVDFAEVSFCKQSTYPSGLQYPFPVALFFVAVKQQNNQNVKMDLALSF